MNCLPLGAEWGFGIWNLCFYAVDLQSLWRSFLEKNSEEEFGGCSTKTVISHEVGATFGFATSVIYETPISNI
ncbi:hypothetical protein PRUPE_1G075200 [Prunus persica]|uniref:Uncharacterized protein n=1 Tax=Prunus persica TaxID=3760 RepID=A0A251QU22_PRUPE|nr:hypothetical protein PRUPE_1G075200 [Prunus persica]